MGLTNYARHKLLLPFVGLTPLPALPNGTYVSVLTANPSGDGTSSGGTLTSLGAAEWTLARIKINEEGGSNPQWIRQASDHGGWEAALVGPFGWTGAQTLSLASDTTVTGIAVYDASTGGNMWVWESLVTPIVVVQAAALDFATDKLRVRLYGDRCV